MTNNAPDEYAWIQVIDGRPVQGFRDHQLLCSLDGTIAVEVIRSGHDTHYRPVDASTIFKASKHFKVYIQA